MQKASARNAAHASPKPQCAWNICTRTSKRLSVILCTLSICRAATQSQCARAKSHEKICALHLRTVFPPECDDGLRGVPASAWPCSATLLARHAWEDQTWQKDAHALGQPRSTSLVLTQHQFQLPAAAAGRPRRVAHDGIPNRLNCSIRAPQCDNQHSSMSTLPHAPAIASSGAKDDTLVTEKSVPAPANAVSAAPKKKEPPPEKPESIRLRSLVIFSFWAVILCLGLPIWWKTTTIYRAPLPLDQMMDWADGRV
jgi:hypothetical protein